MASIVVQERTMLGKGACKKLRSQGNIPGIIYGLKKDVLPIQFTLENLLVHLYKTKIFELKFDNHSEDVMIKDIHYDTFGEKIYHVDFIRIDKTVKIHAEVPIVFVGVPKATLSGGVWGKHLQHVEIACLPGDIPKNISLNVESLRIGEQIHVKDLLVPEGATIITDAKLLVTLVSEKKKEEEVPEEQNEQAETEEAKA